VAICEFRDISPGLLLRVTDDFCADLSGTVAEFVDVGRSGQPDAELVVMESLGHAQFDHLAAGICARPSALRGSTHSGIPASQHARLALALTTHGRLNASLFSKRSTAHPFGC